MSESSSSKTQQTTPQANRVQVRFEKSPNFQTVYAVGAWGRVTGHGEIILSLYNEVPQLTNNAIYTQAKDGSWIGVPELEFEHSSPLVREIYVDVVMSVDTAMRFRDSITHFIQLAEQQQKQQAALAAKKQE